MPRESKGEALRAAVEQRANVVDMIRAAARDVLSESGRTQRELAEFLDVTPSAVSQMLNSRNDGLTMREAYVMELFCGVEPGTIGRRAMVVSSNHLFDNLHHLTDHQQRLVIGIVSEFESAATAALARRSS